MQPETKEVGPLGTTEKRDRDRMVVLTWSAEQYQGVFG
jgi:hypothetical protein